MRRREAWLGDASGETLRRQDFSSAFSILLNGARSPARLSAVSQIGAISRNCSYCRDVIAAGEPLDGRLAKVFTVSNNLICIEATNHEGDCHRASRLSHRDDRQPGLRRLPRAPRARDLHWHLRARPPDRRRQRHARRRRRSRPLAEDSGRSLPRRQFRLRLQLGGRRRPARQAPDPPRPRLAHLRLERRRRARVRRLVRRGRLGDDAGHQPRLARPRRSAQLRRIRQRPDRQLLGRPAQGERAGGAVRRQALVPRQRDGRPLAGRPQDRARIRPPRQRSRQDCAPSIRRFG